MTFIYGLMHMNHWLILLGVLMACSSGVHYSYYSTQGLCRLVKGRGVFGTAWRAWVNVVTLGLYGFVFYDDDGPSLPLQQQSE